MQRFAKILAAAAITAAAAPDTAFAAFNCSTPTAPRVVTVNPAQTTTSQDFVDLPGATETILVGDAFRCVMIEFAAQVRAARPGVLRLRATVDGTATISPNFIDVQTPVDKFDERGAIFVLNNVTPANQQRTVKLQFASPNGDPVSVARAVMTVHYSNLPD